MTILFNRKETTPFRRRLRAEVPEPERRLWQALRGKQMQGAKFRRQYGIGPYVVDFFCPAWKPAVEVDGETHFMAAGKEHDARRDAFIRDKGILILRFSNRDVLENLDGVVDTILAMIETQDLPLTPSLARRGNKA